MDYDADGRTDIVTGSYTGQFYLFRRQPDGGFAQRDLVVDEDGTTLMMPFETAYSVTPELVDMDADGDLDLVVGSEDGEVTWYRHTGKNDAPRYAKGELLVAAGRTGYDPEGSTPKHHGMRVKVHVTDWNEDGKVDLLVGDVTWQETKLTPLTESEAKEKQALNKELSDLYDRRTKAQDAAQKEALAKAIADVRAKLRPLQRTKLHTHGWVWLYLRR
ncbi:MAG: FG-GAP-like repeat-containing protein [Planctomycetota bacterium]